MLGDVGASQRQGGVSGVGPPAFPACCGCEACVRQVQGVGEGMQMMF